LSSLKSMKGREVKGDQILAASIQTVLRVMVLNMPAMG